MEQGIAKVKIDDINFQQLMVDVKNRHICIPDFQREFVWELNQIINLLDSIYHHYPIGSFLLWRSNDEIESYRTIGDIGLETSKEGIVHYVLDGQQRITSLFASLEKADIKVKVHGKTIKKKIEIYFDLDEEAFLSSPFDNFKQKDIYKPKRILSIPNHDNYFSFLGTFHNKLKESNYSTKAISKWLSDEVYEGAPSYAKMFMNTCVNWNFLEKKYDHYTEGKNIDIIYDKNRSRMLKILADYFLWFDEIYHHLSNTSKINELELKELINETSKETLKDTWYLRQRLNWLQGLRIGDYTNGVFSLSEKETNEIQKVISEREQEKAKLKEQQDEFKKRFISVKQIVGSSILKIARELNDERYDALEKVHTNFQNYPFSIIYVLDQPIDVACEIFERINNSGKVLNLVDLMVAKSYSPSFNLRKKLSSFLLELSKKDYRDIPEVTIIQCMAAIIGKSIKRRDILSLNKKIISSTWDDIVESIRQAIDFLKSNLNLVTSKIIPYNTLLVPLAYYFYKSKESYISADAEKKITLWFWKASFSTRYDSAVETKINDDLIEFDAILQGKDPKFDDTTPFINEERIINQKLNLGSAFCKSILTLMNQQKPLEFINNVPISLNTLSKLNSAELHHIFPQAYLRNNAHEYLDLKDSIINIALAGSALNKKYKDQPPSVYLKKCANKNPNFNNSLKSHLIHNYVNSGLENDEYSKFLSYRAGIILNEIRAKIGVFTETEEIFQKDEKRAINRFEKRMRTSIDKILSKESPHYFKNLNNDIRSSIEPRIKNYLKSNPTQSKENIFPLDFCLVFDYYNIIISKWNRFKPIFGDQKGLKNHITNINNFRNALMHSREIDTPTRKLAEASLVWFDNIFKNQSF